MRLIEKSEVTGTSGKSYAMNVYPADMRFNDFIPGVFLLFSEDSALFMGESDNVDAWLQKNDALGRLQDEGFARIGFIRNGSPEVRAAIMNDLDSTVTPKLAEF